MSKRLVLGLDLGIASCGFALLDFENKEILAAGVRCFEKAENPKTGASLALPRRQKRMLRRTIRRRRQRMRKIWALGVRAGLVQPKIREILVRDANP